MGMLEGILGSQTDHVFPTGLQGNPAQPPCNGVTRTCLFPSLGSSLLFCNVGAMVYPVLGLPWNKAAPTSWLSVTELDSCCSGGQKFKIKAWQGYVPSEGLEGGRSSLPLSYILVSLAIPGILWLVNQCLHPVPRWPHRLLPVCLCLSF